MAAVAVSRTAARSNSGCEQSRPQVIPGPVTVPLPVPLLTIVTSVRARKLGVAVVLARRVKEQLGLVEPTHAVPLQLVNTKPALGVARRLTGVP